MVIQEGQCLMNNGEVIGIVSSIISQSGGFEGLGFAVSIETIYEEIIDSEVKSLLWIKYFIYRWSIG